MGLYIVVIFIGVLLMNILPVYVLLRNRRRRQEKMEDSEPIPDEIVSIRMGKHTIWLRNCEVENFQAQPRKTRLYLAKVFESKVRKGLLVPIKEGDKIIGYVTKAEYNKKKDGATTNPIG